MVRLLRIVCLASEAAARRFCELASGEGVLCVQRGGNVFTDPSYATLHRNGLWNLTDIAKRVGARSYFTGERPEAVTEISGFVIVPKSLDDGIVPVENRDGDKFDNRPGTYAHLAGGCPDLLAFNPDDLQPFERERMDGGLPLTDEEKERLDRLVSERDAEPAFWAEWQRQDYHWRLDTIDSVAYREAK